MLKEIAIIISSVVCVFYIFMGFMAPSYGWIMGPKLAFPGAIGYVNGYPYPVALTIGVIALAIFASLMIYSGIHIKNLYSKSPKKAKVFLVIKLIGILITFVSLWAFFQIVKFGL
jgi:hypothetical protein